MNDNDILSVPYVVYEGEMARSERMVKRLIVALIVSIVIIFATNATWIWLWNQYDYSSDESIVEMETRGAGNTNYIGNSGDITNGIENQGD